MYNSADNHILYPIEIILIKLWLLYLIYLGLCGEITCYTKYTIYLAENVSERHYVPPNIIERVIKPFVIDN